MYMKQNKWRSFFSHSWRCLSVRSCLSVGLCGEGAAGGERQENPLALGFSGQWPPFIFHSQSIVLTAEKTAQGCSPDHHRNVTERASPSSPSCDATQPLRCHGGHVSDVLLFLFSVCWLSLWFVSLFHKRTSSVSSREKYGDQQRSDSVFCMSFLAVF